ncbi:MAG: nuclear transport factor 2 family protein [Gemmatimonadaceae bacterium]
MTKSPLPVLLSMATMFAACAPAKPAASSDSAQLTAARTTAVRDSVKELLAEFTERMNKSDMDGVAKLYSNDSTFFWIEGAGVRYESVKDVRDGLQSLKNVPEIELKFYETRIDVLSATIANVRTEFSQTFMNGTGKGDTYGGYMTITVVREADGWRLRNGHTSSRKPRP